MTAFSYYASIITCLLGVAAATAFTLHFSFISLLGVMGCGLLCLAWRFWSDDTTTKTLLVIGLLAVFFVFGWWRGELARVSFAESPLAHMVGTTVTLTGEVVREPDRRERTTHVYVKLPEVNDLVLVSVDRYASVVYGDRIEVQGRLEQPTSFETDYGRTFLYPEYLKAKGVQYRISFAELTVLERGHGNIVIRYLLLFKDRFVTALGTSLPDPQAGLGVGLLLGVKQALGTELETAFRKTGIIHIVVLSGYNVMLVVAFVMFFLAVLLPFRARLVVGIIAIVLFALLVGLSATVVRASIMASLFLLAPLLGRQYHLLRALFAAGLIMVLVNPYILLYDVGFQLSFLATLGLILVAPQFELLLMERPGLIKVREFFIATLATQIAVAPLLLYQIGELSLIALVVNVLVLPMVGVAMLLTFITGILAMIMLPLAGIVAVPTYWSLTYIILIAEWFAMVPYATVSAPPFPWWLLGFSYLVMGLSYVWFVQRPVRTSRTEAVMTSVDTVEDFADWTIVDEEKLKAVLVKVKTPSTPIQSKDSSPDKETPIFFR
jgi:competence protein ComEC